MAACCCTAVRCGAVRSTYRRHVRHRPPPPPFFHQQRQQRTSGMQQTISTGRRTCRRPRPTPTRRLSKVYKTIDDTVFDGKNVMYRRHGRQKWPPSGRPTPCPTVAETVDDIKIQKILYIISLSRRYIQHEDNSDTRCHHQRCTNSFLVPHQRCQNQAIEVIEDCGADRHRRSDTL